MSKFFTASAFSSSESDSDSSDDEGGVPVVPTVKTPRTVAFKAVEQEPEDEAKRIVRSMKQKRYDEMHKVLAAMKNHKVIKDVSKVLSDFEELIAIYDKSRKVVLQEGVPNFYVRALGQLEQFVNECWEDREGRKQMNKLASRSLGALRQNLRRYLKDWDQEITQYRENPELFDDAEEAAADEGGGAESGAGSGDEGDDAALRKAGVGAPEAGTSGTDGGDFIKVPESGAHRGISIGSMSGSDSEDEFWDEDDSADSSADEATIPTTYDWRYFLKKPKTQEEEAKEKEKSERKKDKQKAKDERMKKKKVRLAAAAAGDEIDGPREGGVMGQQQAEKTRLFAKDVTVNHQAVLKKLAELMQTRGKKSINKDEQLEMVVSLRNAGQVNDLGCGLDAILIFAILDLLFDYSGGVSFSMKPHMWERYIDYVDQLIQLAEDNLGTEIWPRITEEAQNIETAPYQVQGCLVTAVEKVDSEFVKMLQSADAHSTEYVERLKDERRVCEIIERLLRYYEQKQASPEYMCRIYMRKIEHMYYKFDRKIVDPLELATPAERELIEKTETEVEIERLCKYIYSNDSQHRLRTRAILCRIYHHGLHNQWFEARDLMLMSHLQDMIKHSDVPTMILYNRAMVQLGLCAFRQGKIKDAHDALVDIQSSNRAKELLAQGLIMAKMMDHRTAEQEEIEKRRQVPYHIHINLELLECVYLVSAMLSEVPFIAAHELDARRRPISKNFHFVLRQSERQTLIGPPETMREHLVAAAKAMKVGDWRACFKFIVNPKMNAKVWDLFHKPDRVRTMLERSIKEESLRTYLFTYSAVYDSITIDFLLDMFELPEDVVYSIISKMIMSEELAASLDQPTRSVVMHRTEPSQLQALAFRLSEKISNLSDSNERLVDGKLGIFTFGGPRQGQGGGYRRPRQQFMY